MKKYLYIIAVSALALTSCRPMGDDLLSYGQNDTQAFIMAGHSFEGQFIAFWNAMNENYCIWDYEEQFGMDWDEVYNTYLPKFRALDDSTRNVPVSDAELKALYSQFLDSLHDGHSAFQILNLQTGNRIVVNPNDDRNQRERPQVYADEDNITTLDAYRTSAVDSRYRVLSYDETGSRAIVLQIIDTTANRLIAAATAYQQAIDAAGGPDQFNDTIYSAATRIKENAQILLDYLAQPTVVKSQLPSLVNLYNDFANRYGIAAQQIGVNMTMIDAQMPSDDLKFIYFALFEGNIAYLRFGGFALSAFLPDEALSADTTTMYYAYQLAVRRVWHQWFDAIQTLSAKGQLGGVIIDVRNNGGGATDDYQYVLGAMLPSGGWHSHTLRVKNGVGRLDFAPLTPFVVKTYSGPHAVISQQPIVLLANSHSVSMSENTTWGVKSQPNGHFIGTRTYGGLSALGPNPEDYSNTYSGAFGVKNVTPFYGYVPKFVCLYPDANGNLSPVEGHGFDPDESVPFDLNLWQTQSRDNQLEKALDYIHNY